VMDALTRHVNGLVIKLLIRMNMFVTIVNWLSILAKLIACKFHSANDCVLKIKNCLHWLNCLHIISLTPCFTQPVG
jgi:hypothetical protein